MAVPPTASTTPSFTDTQKAQAPKPAAPKPTDVDAASKALKKRQKKFSLKGRPITDKEGHAEALGKAMGAFTAEPESTDIADIGQAFADVRKERKLKAQVEKKAAYDAELMARLRALTQSTEEVA